MRSALVFAVVMGLASVSLFANEDIKMLVDLSFGGRLIKIDHNGSGTVMCVGSKGTMIRSSDGGSIWSQIAVRGLVDFTDVKFHSGTWHAVGGMWDNTTQIRKLVLLRSTDDGVSWLPSNEIEGTEKLTLFNFYGLSLVKGPLLNVFVIARAGAVFHSTNGGESWRVNSIIGGDTTDRTFRATALSDGTLIALLKDSQYVSKDYGNTWASTAHNLIGEPVQLAAVNDTLVAITRVLDVVNSTFFVRVSISTNQGMTWQQGDAQSPKSISRFLIISPTHMVSVGTGSDGLSFDATSNGGVTWSSIISPYFMNVHDLVHINDNTVLVCGDRKGILRLDLGDLTITPFSMIRQNLNFAGRCSFFRVQSSGDLTFSPLNVLQINRSINGGATWTLDSLHGSESSSILDAIDLPGGSQVVLKQSYPYLLTRTSPESPWKAFQDDSIGTPRMVSRSSQFSFGSDSVGLFVAENSKGRNGLCLTVDRGETWKSRFSDSVDCGPTRMISDALGTLIVSASYERNDSNARTGSTSIATSSDAGATWKQQPFIMGLGIRDLVLVDRATMIVSSISATTVTDGKGYLHRSTDGGTTWTDVLKGRRHWIGTVASQGDTVIAASMNTDSLFLSLDAGASWKTRALNGVFQRRISFSNSHIQNNTLYLAGAYGDTSLTTTPDGPIILSMPIADLVSHVAESEQVNPISTYGELLNASPNPSYGASRVSCTLPVECSSLVVVTVFSADGTNHFSTESQISHVENNCTLTIETEKLTPGSYYALINTPQARYFTSFVIVP